MARASVKSKPPTRAPKSAPPLEFVLPQPLVVETPPEVTSRVVLVTPELAQQILGRNNRNRHLRPTRIDRYALDMVEGRWKLNGEPIILSDKGNLMNGQHRLQAVVRANVSVYMMLTEGVDENAFATMDAGINRTAGDVLAMNGVANFNHVAAMTRMILNYKAGASINRACSPQQIEEAVEVHPEIEKYATSFGALFNLGRSVAVACCVIASRFGEAEEHAELVSEFVHGVASGANLADGDPRLIFRNKLIAMNYDRQRRPEQSVVWYYTQRALFHHLNGNKLAKLATERGVAPYFSEIPTATREMVRDAW